MLSKREDAALCTFCPKLCRTACPVSEATGREALIPQQKVAEVGRAVLRERASESSAEAAFACTGCMRCRSHCQLGVEPAAVLFRHRVDVISAGMSPAASQQVAQKFAEKGNIHGEDLAAQLSRIAARAPVARAESRIGLFAGCTALARVPAEVRAAFVVAQMLDLPLAAEAVGGLCCGYPLWVAGHREAFAANALRFAALVRKREIYALDPGCAFALTKFYPEVSVKLPQPVRPFVDFVAERLSRAAGRPRLNEAVVYHDACNLGRGLSRFEEPRIALRVAVEEVREAPYAREDARCSGAGGLLPWTMPKVSEAIAAARAEELLGVAEKVVSACPASARKLELAGAKVEGFASILARWLSGGG